METHIAMMHHIKPAIDRIKNTWIIKDQAAVDHRDLAAACQVAGIDSSKVAVTAKCVYEQLAWMLGWAHSKE